MTERRTDEFEAEDIHNLLDYFSKNTYRVREGDLKGDFITEKCLLLFAKDYKYSVIKNFSGELCSHYPTKLVLMEYERSSTQDEYGIPEEDDVESIYNLNQLQDMFRQSRFARCRSRFVMPVILYKGKHICRSGTLASGAEMYGKMGMDFLFTGGEQRNGPQQSLSSQSDMQAFDRFRGQDIKLLKTLSVDTICDLMVEKKKVKFYMNITSSEKVDKENRYGDFCIISAPYPGCEFFREWKDNSYAGDTMKFDWSQGYVDACLDIPRTTLLSQLSVDWPKYKQWNLIQLTQNYLKLLLHIIKEGENGMLVHCISGWDRTPMFISLLRLSLWADGVVHSTLTPVEILYLTLAYDWFLFGHNLTDRLSKGEEILYFCFNFLLHITSEEFSVLPRRASRCSLSRNCSECSVPTVSQVPDGTEKGRLSCRGSCNSINSLGGSSVEGGPIMFACQTSVPEDDVFTRSSSSNHLSRGRPISSGCVTLTTDGPVHFQSSPRLRSSPLLQSSSPMDVPSIPSAHKQSQRSDSPALGSWQVISSSGNFHRDFPLHDHCPSCSSHSSSASSPRIHSCEEASETTHCSQRFQKLDSVRRIFHNAYTNKIIRTYKMEASTGAGGITNLLDQFAEKVGIKSAKS